jgi:TolB-like protein/Flp pilus assembly protein TadD
MLAVLPFENLTGDPQQEYLGDGLTDGMIGQLGRVSPERLAVIARTSITQYKGTRKSAKQIGSELGVSYLLESSVKRGDNRIRIDAHLIQVSDETEVWADAYDREIKDVLAVQSEIAQAIAVGVRVKLGQDRPAASRTRSVNPAAYDAYLRGRYFSKTVKEQRTYFDRAIGLDPQYAAAYAALAQRYLYSDLPSAEAAAKAKAAALRAVALEPDLPEAHAALARTLLEAQWDWVGAEEHFRRALALDPNSGDTLVPYARLHLSLGRFNEAIAARKRAAELSPSHLETRAHLGLAYYMARRYDDAIAELRPLVEIDQSFALGHLFLAMAYAWRGSYQQALAEADKCGEFEDWCLARAVVLSHARTGQPERGLEAIGRMKVIARTRAVDAIQFARAYAALGRRDDSLAWLEKAYSGRNIDLIMLRVDSDWDLLRGDSRFADLIRRVGIPAP